MMLPPCRHRGAVNGRWSYCRAKGTHMLNVLSPAHPCDGCTLLGEPRPPAPPPPQPLVTLIVPRCDPFPAPTSERCVVVVVGGDRCEAEHAITGPAQREYAERCGADYVVIRPLESQPRAVANKYAAALLAAQYRQTLLIDADAVPMPTAPSVFDHVPAGAWGIALDRPETDTKGHAMQSRGFSALAAALGEPPCPTSGRVWNSGFVLMPPHAARIYCPPPAPVPDHHCVEQDLLTHRLVAAWETVVTLGAEWNAGWHRTDFPQVAATAHVLHASGCQDHSVRLPLLSRWAAGERVAPIPPKGHKGYQPEWAAKPAPTDHAARLAACEACPSWRRPPGEPDSPQRCDRLAGCCGGAKRPDPSDPLSVLCGLNRWPGQK